MKDSVYDKGLLNGQLVDIETIYDLLNKEREMVYEVIRIIDGKPLFFEEHIRRLNNSLKLIGLRTALSSQHIKGVIQYLLEHFNEKNINVKIAYYENGEANLIVYVLRSHYPAVKKYQEGYYALLMYEEREKPNAKILDNQLRSLIKEILNDENADECIFVSEKGEIHEGSRSNLFFVKGSMIITAPDQGVLLGTTRSKIIEICGVKRIHLQRRVIRLEELTFFDAAFVTGTSIGVMPVNNIASIPYASSSNRMVERMMEAYEMEVKRYIATH
jgi:branched-chain amino acid aminotransferase